jgi:ATP-dependent 26S proteasome regulatory subunit
MFDLNGLVIQPNDATLDDVILTSQQRAVVERHILGYARNLDHLKARGARGTRGVLLEGVPGCGKSMLLRAIAHELKGISICMASPGQLSRGSSIATLRHLVDLTSPCLVFLEEIDIFGMDRQRSANPELAELLQQMDGISQCTSVLWIATTNRPEVVERALADRPGRFDRRVSFGPLPGDLRRVLIQRLASPQVITEEALDLAVELTSGSTGAVIRELIETLRIISDDELFDTKQIELAWRDCEIVKPELFGFARAKAHPSEVTGNSN